MKVKVTVSQAILRGHLMVNVPVILVFFGCPAVAIYGYTQGLIPLWGAAVAFFTGIVLAWLVWGFMVTKWKVWAYENVRNLHELKRRAVEEKLIWHEGSVFEKTEIKNSAEKQKLKSLERRFEIEDDHREDYTMPFKKEIYHSKVQRNIQIIASILVLGIGVLFFWKGTVLHLVLGVIAWAIGVYDLFVAVKKARQREPQIIIDQHGITTVRGGFFPWASIQNEHVFKEGFGRSAKTNLIFYVDGRCEMIAIDPLNITYNAMAQVLRTYRIRHEKQVRLSAGVAPSKVYRPWQG